MCCGCRDGRGGDSWRARINTFSRSRHFGGEVCGRRRAESWTRIIARMEILRGSERAAMRAFRWISEAGKPIPKVRGLWHRAAIRNLYWMRGRDWPEVIEYRERGWELRG